MRNSIVPLLPHHVYAEFQCLDDASTADINEFLSRIPFLTSDDVGQLVIGKFESGKPFLKLNDNFIGYSISHTRNCYLLAVNRDGEIGVDVEKSGRMLHPKLRVRICNDIEFWDESIDTLQIWTIKEAVLKLTGTGLRTNMNKVVVKRRSEIKFQVHHDNKEISVVSLEKDGYWISVAWSFT